jgi:hypothetical protein
MVNRLVDPFELARLTLVHISGSKHPQLGYDIHTSHIPPIPGSSLTTTPRKSQTLPLSQVLLNKGLYSSSLEIPAVLDCRSFLQKIQPLKPYKHLTKATDPILHAQPYDLEPMGIQGRTIIMPFSTSPISECSTHK